VHIPDVLRTKLDPKSELCVFFGYSETQKAYRFWNPNSSKIVISRDAIFVKGTRLLYLIRREKVRGLFILDTRNKLILTRAYNDILLEFENKLSREVRFML
jgi:hypothetical protein